MKTRYMSSKQSVDDMAKLVFAIRNWAIRSVHSNGICQWAFQLLSFFKVLSRRAALIFTGVWSGNKGHALVSDPELGRYQTYRDEYAKLPGWFVSEAAAMWDCLLCFQKKQNIVGHMLEIGVWKGKSATCATLHAREDENFVFVDRMILPELKNTLGTIRRTNNLFIQAPSSELRNQPQLMQLGARFRWIHIDGEHSGKAVKQDVALAHELLNERGIICVDDFPSTAYPQINFAVIE